MLMRPMRTSLGRTRSQERTRDSSSRKKRNGDREGETQCLVWRKTDLGFCERCAAYEQAYNVFRRASAIFGERPDRAV